MKRWSPWRTKDPSESSQTWMQRQLTESDVWVPCSSAAERLFLTRVVEQQKKQRSKASRNTDDEGSLHAEDDSGAPTADCCISCERLLRTQHVLGEAWGLDNAVSVRGLFLLAAARPVDEVTAACSTNSTRVLFTVMNICSRYYHQFILETFNFPLGTNKVSLKWTK